MIWLAVWILCCVSFVLGCYWGAGAWTAPRHAPAGPLQVEHGAGNSVPEGQGLPSERYMSAASCITQRADTEDTQYGYRAIVEAR
jgi:hypothetical protein